MDNKWTVMELDFLKDNLHLTNGNIADFLKRTEYAVKSKIRDLGLKREIISKKVTKENQIDLIQQIGTEIVKQFRPIKLENYASSKLKRGKEEASILDLSDIHIGMVNKIFDSEKGREICTYNFDIFKSQLELLISGIKEINKLLSTAYVLPHLYINILGDIITNDRIFPEQVFEIDKVVGLQVWDAVNYLIYFINIMKSVYNKITVTCVVGNHGRSMPDGFYNEPTENNFEFFIYKVLERQFSEDNRVTIIVPSTRQYILNIMGWKHLLEHGDSFRGFTENIIEQQVKNLYVNVGNFHVLDMGHFHKLRERELSDKVIVKQNGGWIYKDNWVRKVFKDYSIPKQWFYGCNEKRPETWSYKIDFRG